MSHADISTNGSPPHQIFMWDTKYKSNPVGIGSGIDYVTWGNIQKWIHPHIQSSCGTQDENPILWV